MEIKPVNNTVINLNSMLNKDTASAEGQGLSWTKGQVLPALILARLAENLYTARVGGTDSCIQCFDFLPLNTKVGLELQGIKEDTLLVKPAPPNPTQPVTQEDLMQRLFNQLNIKDTPLYRQLIQEFLKQELPLKAPTLEMAEKILQKLAGETPDNMEKAVLGIKLGLPPEPVVLNAVHSFLKDIDSFQQGNQAKLQLFIHKLVAILGELRTGAPAKTSSSVLQPKQLPALLSKEGYELLQKVQEYLSNITIDPEKGITKTSEQLKLLLNSQLTGVVNEEKLDNRNTELKPVNSFSDATTNVNFNKPTYIKGNSETNIPVAQQVLNSVNNAALAVEATAKNLSGADLDSPRAAIPNTAGINLEANKVLPTDKLSEETSVQILRTMDQDTLKQNHSSAAEVNPKAAAMKLTFRDTDNILQIFSKLIDDLKEALKTAGEATPVKSLVQEGIALERQMVGHQVFQTLNKVEGQPECLYFNLPFIKQEEKQTWGQIKIIKDNTQSKNIDPKHLSMALLLNTLSLGPLLLELKVRNKEIITAGKVTEEWVANLLKEAWPKLQESFGKMGYQLSRCDWRIGSFATNLLTPVLKKDDADCSLQAVDLKV